MTLKRIFDFLFALFLIISIALPAFFLWIAIRLTSKGPGIYWSDRVGKNNIIFKMPKFRSMIIGTPPIATHLLKNPKSYLTPIGSFLRIYSLDEIPQLLSILFGQMSFVGPRPALFNQKDLIKMRTKAGISLLCPGLTGWAQVNYSYGESLEDSLIKLQYDLYYIKHRSIFLDLNITIKTISTVLFYRGQ